MSPQGVADTDEGWLGRLDRVPHYVRGRFFCTRDGGM